MIGSDDGNGNDMAAAVHCFFDYHAAAGGCQNDYFLDV